MQHAAFSTFFRNYNIIREQSDGAELRSLAAQPPRSAPLNTRTGRVLSVPYLSP